MRRSGCEEDSRNITPPRPWDCAGRMGDMRLYGMWLLSHRYDSTHSITSTTAGGSLHYLTGPGTTTPPYHPLLCPLMLDSEPAPSRIPTRPHLRVLASPRTTTSHNRVRTPSYSPYHSTPVPQARNTASPPHHPSPQEPPNHQNGVTSEPQDPPHSTAKASMHASLHD
jgi:hypothetical protein